MLGEKARPPVQSSLWTKPSSNLNCNKKSMNSKTVYGHVGLLLPTTISIFSTGRFSSSSSPFITRLLYPCRSLSLSSKNIMIHTFRSKYSNTQSIFSSSLIWSLCSSPRTSMKIAAKRSERQGLLPKPTCQEAFQLTSSHQLPSFSGR